MVTSVNRTLSREVPMLYPRLASLAVFIVCALAAYLVFPSGVPSPLAEGVWKFTFATRVLVGIVFCFLAYSGICGVLLSFCVEPTGEPGKFRTRDTLLGKLPLLATRLWVTKEDQTKGLEYCELSMLSAVTFLLSIGAIASLAGYCTLAIVDLAALFSVTLFLLAIAAGMGALILIHYIAIVVCKDHPGIGAAIYGVIMATLVGAIYYFVPQRSLEPVNWSAMWASIGVVAVLAASILGLFGIKSLLKKMTFYARFCPVQEVRANEHGDATA